VGCVCGRFAHLQIRRPCREESRFSSLLGSLRSIRIPSAMNFRNQNVTESETSDAGMAMVPLVLLVVLVLMIPPQLAMAVVLS